MNKVMTNRLLRQHWIVVFAAVCVFASAWPSPIGVAQPSSLPHLRRQGAATQLIVDGKPFLVLGGELGNSSSSSLEYMRPVWPKLVALNLNTVLVPVYWELIEPVEGKFDFTLVDSLIQEARKHGLRLAPLWFASWKNSMSCYAPAWVKTNQQLFIPEAILGPLSAVNALYAIGQHDAIGFSPFSIESVAEPARSLLAGSYDVLTQLAPLTRQGSWAITVWIYFSKIINSRPNSTAASAAKFPLHHYKGNCNVQLTELGLCHKQKKTGAIFSKPPPLRRPGSLLVLYCPGGCGRKAGAFALRPSA